MDWISKCISLFVKSSDMHDCIEGQEMDKNKMTKFPQFDVFDVAGQSQ